ncbi:small ubiquitin-related modifier, SUMO domain protein [Pseudohyphozyma bogoriensis]|nr:small ubiquitin-related modifier, SUMO domain protein [Pseudohyphozyma bogoriensis]
MESDSSELEIVSAPRDKTISPQKTRSGKSRAAAVPPPRKPPLRATRSRTGAAAPASSPPAAASTSRAATQVIELSDDSPPANPTPVQPSARAPSSPAASRSRTSASASVEPNGRPKPKKLGRSGGSGSVPLATQDEEQQPTPKAKVENKGKAKAKARTTGDSLSDQELDAFFTKKPIPPRRNSSKNAARGLSGAEKRMMEKGVGKNRRKKRKGESTDEEEEAERKRREKEKEREEESDDSLEVLEDDFGSDLESRKNKGKKRVRSRSKSLTPPKPMEQAVMDSIMSDLRENMGHNATYDSDAASSSSHFDDPDYQAIFKSHADDDVVIVGGNGASQSRNGLNDGEKEDESTVTINVSMVWDPRREVKSVAARDAFTRPTAYTVGKRESVRRIFTAIAQQRGVEIDQLVLVYRSQRVWPFANPNILKIIHQADFKCYMKEVWEYVQEESKRGHQVPEDEEKEEEEEVVEEVEKGDEDGDEGGGGAPGLFNISIRGSQTQVLSLAVKPTTTIAVLLKQYCKKFGIDDGKMAKMWVEWEGEKLDKEKTIGSYDEIEEEETIEVREPKK